jgi:hypothetical protein
MKWPLATVICGQIQFHVLKAKADLVIPSSSSQLTQYQLLGPRKHGVSAVGDLF